ncbi:hypothetical protein QTP70_020196 [Hemibagrus guttatus]|uniref:Uncharacterized protein n=1 Tax=Hemibagrus guttatus TaxID=175788 RepID=A0AAE0RG41_9TELE|nr:hypothetical protein QTP70_020196 [Hemibagrus guttatus]
MDGDVCVRLRCGSTRPQRRKSTAQRRRRSELLGVRMCLIGLLLAVLSGLTNWTGNSGYIMSSVSSEVSETWESRRLLQHFTNESEQEAVWNCTQPAFIKLHAFSVLIFCLVYFGHTVVLVYMSSLRTFFPTKSEWRELWPCTLLVTDLSTMSGGFLLNAGFATANHLSPPIPIFCILNTCTH